MGQSFENVIAIRVRVGTVYSDKGGQIYEVKRIINHGRYDDNTLNYDFALLELANAIKFDNRTIKAIPLPNVYDFVSVRKMCFVSGWGLYSKYSSNEFPNVLQGVEVPIVPHGKCQQAYGNDITEQMLCAGFLYGSKDGKNVKNNSNLNKLFGIFEMNVICFISQLLKVIVVALLFVHQLTVNESCLVS